MRFFSLRKKRGRIPQSSNLMSNFANILSSNGLEDLGFQGYPFTWHREDPINGGIKERLD